MAHEVILLQIVLITIAVYFGRLGFNKLFGLSSSERRELMQKTMDLQTSMKETTGDPEAMAALQKEAMVLMQQMLKKQMIPMCVSCISFWILWAILGVFYAEYSVNAGLLPFSVFIFGNGWEGVYILTSFSILGISILIKYLYKKKKGIESSGPGLFDLLSGGASQATPRNLLISRPDTTEAVEKEEASSDEEREDSWKDRIKS